MFKLIIAAGTLAVMAPAMANAGQSIDMTGSIACVNDKWDETEPAKGHKQVVYAGRCVLVPNDATAPTYVEDCAGNYEYLPDGTWTGVGSCTTDFKGGNTLSVSWEEGSALKEYPYSYTGGTGKYKGAKGGGTYKTEELSSTIYAGRKKGRLELP